jgi:hypothetical protein
LQAPRGLADGALTVFTGSHMRRLVSITLLLLFALPLFSPLLAATRTGTSLRACCRRDGKHHCTSPESLTSTAATIHDRCPYSLAHHIAAHTTYTPDPTQNAIFAGIVAHTACHAQTEARYRISFDRSRQKRGPPSDLS